MSESAPGRPGRSSPYRALLSARYRMMLQYRAAAVAGISTQVFFGLIMIMVLEAFFRSSASPQPMTFPEVVSYVWLGQALLAAQPWNHDIELEGRIRAGDVAYELVRPVDLYALWYARTLAWRAAGTSLRAAPIFVFAGVVVPWLGMTQWALAPPPGVASAAAFAVAMFVAFLLSVAITTLVHVSLLWTISGDGVSRMMPGVVILFSGMVIPLPLFPDWLQPLFTALPFRGVADVPFRVYSGQIAPGEAWAPISAAAAWTAALVVLGRALLARATRRMVVQGG